MKRDPRKVFIGMAVGSGQDGVTRWETSMSLIRLIASGITEYEFYLCPGGGCDVAHARNLMLHEARTRTDCGLYGFLDSDVVPTAAHLLKILSAFKHPDVMICAGLYPLKSLALRWSYGLWSEESKRHPGLWEVGEVCTGCLFFRPELTDQLVAAYPETEFRVDDARFKGETCHELFAMGPVAPRDWERNGKPYRRRMSEDFMFSMRVRDQGHHIYVDPTVQLGHIGSINYLDLHKPGMKKPVAAVATTG